MVLPMADFGHGKETVYWCPRCHVPVMGARCGTCGDPGMELNIARPGDLRPAMEGSIRLIDRLLDHYFGTGRIMGGRTVMLNKMAGEDRTDEVIVDGRLFGVLRYDLLDQEHRLDLKIDGARMLLDHAIRGTVELEPPPGHLAGKTVDATAVRSSTGYQPGQPVIATAGERVMAAVAVCEPGRELRLREVGRGALALPPPVRWARMVEANMEHLRAMESRAISDLRSVVGNLRLPITVSFSGGKDSLVTFVLASKAFKRVTALYADTGLEFPESRAYMDRFRREYAPDMLIAHPHEDFWREMRRRGPPTKDDRWCCRFCKLEPIAKLLADRFPRGVVTVEGNRRYESFNRSQIRLRENNPHVPGQVRLNPIRDWRAMEVWAYIWWTGLPYNQLYEKDYERVGCWMCASCLESEWQHTRHRHQDLVGRWERALSKVGKERDLASEWASHGFWRWRCPPPKMMKLAERLELDPRQIRLGDDCEQERRQRMDRRRRR